MRADPQTRGRRCAAVTALALALAGCGGGTGVVTPPVAGGAAVAPDHAAAPISARPYAPQASTGSSLPAELVGTWSGADAQGLGSWTLVFGADGSFHESNVQRGITVDGQAAVAGPRLYLQPDRADSQAVTWEVSGTALSLDGTVYQRAAVRMEPGGAGS